MISPPTQRRSLTRWGVLAGRAPECYIGILAALCSGAAKVSLSPGFPIERTAAAARAAALDVIVADEQSISGS
jgi:acyl-coenzyme A synthetase/AMP-(fatty) acid ligase